MGSRTLRLTVWAVVLLVALITVMPSLVGRLLLQAQLRDLGADRVDVRVFHLNLWNGRFTLKGLRADTPGQPQLVVDELIADFGYTDLSARHLHLTELRLDGVQLPIVEQHGRWRIGPLLLPLAADSNDASQAETATSWRWGISQVNLQDIDLRLTYQQLSHHLRLDKLALPSLYQWAPDKLSELHLDGALNGHRLTIDTDTTPLASEPTATSQILIDSLPLGPLLALWQPDQQATLSTKLEVSFSRREDNRIIVKTQGNLTLEKVDIQQSGTRIKLPEGHWQGRSQLQLEEGQLEVAHTDGTLKLKQFSLEQASDHSDAPALALNTDLELDLTLDSAASGSTLSLTQQAELSLANFAFRQQDIAVTSDRLTWQGESSQQLSEQGLGAVNTDGRLEVAQLQLNQGELTLTQQGAVVEGTMATDITQSLSFSGELMLNGTNIRQPPYRVTGETQRWQGDLQARLDTPGLSQLGGDLELKQIDITLTEAPSQLQLGRLQLTQFKLDRSYRLNAKAFDLSRLRLTEESPLLTIENLSIDTLNAGAESTALGTVTLGKLETELLLNAEKQPYLWQQWVTQMSGSKSSEDAQQAESLAPPPESNETTASSTPYPFRFEGFALNAPLVVKVKDERIKGNRPMLLTLQAFQLGAVDTRSEAITPFSFDANINRFGSLQGNGEYSLFSEHANGQWTITLDQLELPPFSPYMNLHTGYQISSGQMHLTTSGTLRQNNLSSNNRLVLNRFDIEQGNAESAQQFNGQLGMPLELAVSIMTDEDDNVTLDIPVSGSLDDPKFGVQSVVNILLAKIAKEGAMGYLSFTLQPYGALLSLGRMAMDAAEGASIKLEPVEFDPGTTQLDDTDRDYLSKLSLLLKERKGLKLKLCGTAVAQDQHYITAMSETIAKKQGVAVEQILTEQQRQTWLYNLAELRGEEVKGHLTTENDVKGSRLFSCLPQADGSREDPPQVQIGL
ncbi:DUF748 domain-containing protein [Motiliproteus sediminis]|uniref:DUF748 domain-containing protein n=1 Tax=Motiliproteus sediminis TaxID=1468178 RepID=UPI001AEFF499|nr:DUF748 domain-containing protein [Motiliproteus sediminis]